MAIREVQLFSQNPQSYTDFSGVRSADIFNKAVVPGVNYLEQLANRGMQEGDALRSQRRQSSEQTDLLSRQRTSALYDTLNQRGLDALGDDFTPDSPAIDYTAPYESAAEENDLPRSDMRETPSQPSQPAPRGNAPSGFDPADFTFNSEARRDKSGKLRVYSPPSGDGGGAYEIAGITERYQPKEAAQLRSLIAEGRQDEAEQVARQFYAKRAEPFTQYASTPGIQLQLTDTVHHRGEGGLRRVLQRATGSDSKDYGQLIQSLESDPEALRKFHEARVSYEDEEVDRGRASRAKFRKGLQNRFDNAYAASLQLSQS